MPRYVLPIVAAFMSLSSGFGQEAIPEKPNILIFFADDLGYGDLGAFGHPTIRTPNLDRMAAQGLRLTNFNVAVASCRPSRTSLLTGRYAARLHPTLYYSSGPCDPIPDRELTLPEALGSAGYATGMTGKWHLNPSPEELGFDRYDDVKRDSDTTRRSTEAAIDFLRANRDGPFFYYLSYHMPHVPLEASERFRGKSDRGLYGDVVEELDWSVGKVLAELRRLELDESTFVLFASDNGPWLKEDLAGGSSGLLRAAKGTTWEGGVRGPTIAWWPATIKPGTRSHAFLTAMDYYATCLALAGVELPPDLIADGEDRRDAFIRGSNKDREKPMIYYYIDRTTEKTPDGAPHLFIGHEIRAVRLGYWKVHFITTEQQGMPKVYHEKPLLYHLLRDPSEKYDIADEHPNMLQQIQEEHAKHIHEPDAEMARYGVPMEGETEYRTF